MIKDCNPLIFFLRTKNGQKVLRLHKMYTSSRDILHVIPRYAGILLIIPSINLGIQLYLKIEELVNVNKKTEQ